MNSYFLQKHVIPVSTSFVAQNSFYQASNTTKKASHQYPSLANLTASLLKAILFFIIVTWLMTASISQAAPQEARDATSELIYNFALLSLSPHRPAQEAYNICTFEEDAGYLEPTKLESQKIQNLQIFLMPIKGIADVKRCNLLYIQDFTPQRALELQQSIQKEAVLTVVHAGNKFSEHGHVVINAHDKRYQFELRMQSAKQAGIVFDARLMKLANNIIND